MTMLAQFSTTGGAVANYIEDVFSTYLYTGTGASQNIVNGVDLSGKGGLVWLKARTFPSGGGYYNELTDTARGVTQVLYSNDTSAQVSTYPCLSSFNSNGFTLESGTGTPNQSGDTYASWTFRKQPKFFDVVTYTGNGASGRSIAHSLGSVPGCIMIKNISAVSDWTVYHQSTGNTKYLTLNSTDAQITGSFWGNTTPTSTDFTVSAAGGHQVNFNGETYVAYIFAHDAGGFGLTGTDNVISCGSYTGNGSASGPTITLGYEPQWLLVKKTSNATNSNWFIVDNMRGFTADGSDATLYPNLSNAEGLFNPAIAPTATGFQILNTGSTYNESGSTYIYIAIRRGPMKVPTDATKVYSPIVASTGAQTTGFVVDSQWKAVKAGGAVGRIDDRLRGVSTTSTGSGNYMDTTSTAAESSANSSTLAWNNTGFSVPPSFSGASSIYWSFSRAPNFFDEVCYTGTGSAGTQTHNLGVAPELIFIKKRSAIGNWATGVSFTPTDSKVGYLNSNADLGTAAYSSGGFMSGQPTSTTISVGTDTAVNASGGTYVAYLFATCPGVSKVGSYTGTGTTQQINCGFTGGARFILIKRTDSTGDWYVYDSARGIVAGNDPYLLLNSTAAEVTSTDYVDTYAAGFELSSTAPAALNASGGTFIFLAIA